MRAREKRVIAVASAVTIIALIVVAAMVITPSTYVLRGRDFGEIFGEGDEYIGVEISVGGGSWIPVSPLTLDVVYYIQNSVKNYVRATVNIKITYSGIKTGTLEISNCTVWLEQGGNIYRLIDAESKTNLNPSSTSGTYDPTGSEFDSGDIEISAVASALGITSDGIYTVRAFFYVKVQGIGEKSGETLTVEVNNNNQPFQEDEWERVTEGFKENLKKED